VNPRTRTAARPAPPFSCTVSEQVTRRATAALRGDLDLANSPLLRDELLAVLATGVDELSIDLSALTFIDSSGVAVLIVVRRSASERGAEFELTSVPAVARRVFEACGVADLFES
jgi:anti-sigma B factor antagonist